MLSIAFVGAGPTTIYTLCALLNEARSPARITIFEAQPRAGLGTPYRPGWNDPAMLSNIASIEIPPIEETLIAWLERQPRARLIRLGIDPDQIDERAFYPRIALGEYFLDQFNSLIARARDLGFTIEIASHCRVTDIVALDDGMQLEIAPASRDPYRCSFDQVVLATGHQWPEEPEVRPGYFLSPWPATALQRIAATMVGIRGSSLTAIDAVVALASAHGTFIETDGDCVEYRINPGAEALRMMMMSRKGLLPEADFFHPVPYEPLSICTPEAMQALIAEAGETLLDRAYLLFKAELAFADPDYAAHVGLNALALEDFAERYFADRAAVDPFEWAERNLEEARTNFSRGQVVAWRYAILRMHEVLALIVPHLDPEALERFTRQLKPIFVDEYATVPHLSIERLLALHRTGHLEVTALGTDYRIETAGTCGMHVTVDGCRTHFPAFIDATGQRPLDAEAFPFPSLLDQGVVRPVDAGEEARAKGIEVDDNFHPVSETAASARLYCLSIPFLLGRHPFIQGITSSHEMGQTVGAAIANEIDAASESIEETSMKLFAIYIGGEHPQAHIEIHDVRFVVAGSIRDTHAQLRAQWWGTPGTLHIDCWAEVDHVDGFDVTLSAEPSTTREKLFFVNLGGYDGRDFAEQHKNMFVVAPSVKEAKARALDSIASWKDAHRDDFYEAEHVFALDATIAGGLHIHLTPAAVPRAPKFTCKYTPLK